MTVQTRSPFRANIANPSREVTSAFWAWQAGCLAAAIVAASCGTNGSSPTGGGGSPGAHSGTAGSGAGGTSTGPGGHPGPGGRGGPGGPGTAGVTGTGGGAGGVAACVPGVEQTIITDCGYPSASSNPLTSVVFNENDVLRAIQPSGATPNGVVRVFYNDEHALTLGVRSVAVKTAAGTTTTDYPVSPLLADPGSAVDPQTGTSALAGDQSGLDASLRPMWPSMFITDVTSDPTSRSGDWQQGGRPLSPNLVYGTWKAAVASVDETITPSKVTITPDADPAKNNWNLAGGDAAPSGLSNEGYGAELLWNVPLTPGHSYRVQVIVHDGDQNKVGGDSGEACVLFCTGGSCGSEGCGSTGTGGSGGVSCPSGTPACGSGTGSCMEGTVCANGCCLIPIPLN